MSIKQAKHMFVIVIAAVGVIVAMMVLKFVSSRMGSAAKPQLPVPEASFSPFEVRVRTVKRNTMPLEQGTVVATSDAVASVCGADEATADLYEARNDALRSVMRSRRLTKEDAAALLDYLASTNDAMCVERVAALKNDVMNLLRRQETPVEGLAATLIVMFECGAHPPAVLDYCVQHLGLMQGGIGDDALRARVHGVLVKAARRKSMPYAGTALYSLAADRRATPQQLEELKRLTLALCAADANTAARIAAIQLAGERGYGEALPVLRKVLSSPRRDTVLDIVAIGSVGLLGDSSDISRLSHFMKCDSRRAPAAEAAIRRINERS
jgi:hypothetical protein